MKIENYMKRFFLETPGELDEHIKYIIIQHCKYDHDITDWQFITRLNTYVKMDFHTHHIEQERTVREIHNALFLNFQRFSLNDCAYAFLNDFNSLNHRSAIGKAINFMIKMKFSLLECLVHVNTDLFDNDSDDPITQALIKEREIQTIKDIIE